MLVSAKIQIARLPAARTKQNAENVILKRTITIEYETLYILTKGRRRQIYIEEHGSYFLTDSNGNGKCRSHSQDPTQLETATEL